MGYPYPCVSESFDGGSSETWSRDYLRQYVLSMMGRPSKFTDVPKYDGQIKNYDVFQLREYLVWLGDDRSSDSLEQMKFLIETVGIDVNTSGYYERGKRTYGSALNEAARSSFSNSLDKMLYLISKGADVNATEWLFSHVLHGAASSKYRPLEKMVLLLTNYADPTRKDEYRKDFLAVYKTEQKGRADMAKFRKARGEKDWDSWLLPAEKYSLEYVKYLSSHIGVIIPKRQDIMEKMAFLKTSRPWLKPNTNNSNQIKLASQ